ncbi:MAG: DUF2461 family protein [Anaerolineae bacterium]
MHGGWRHLHALVRTAQTNTRRHRPQASQTGTILKAPAFKQYYGEMEGEKLKTTPKGYSADDPALDLLQYKQFLASRQLEDDDVLADDAAAQIVKMCAALKPFVGYFADVLGAPS